jgi:hypothetical protein
MENNMQVSVPKSISVSGSLSPQLGLSSTNLKVLQRQLSAHSYMDENSESLGLIQSKGTQRNNK